MEMREKLAQINEKRAKLLLGDGPAAAEAQHGAGKLTARERINLLFDKGTFQEFSLWNLPFETRSDVDLIEHGGDGVITGFGEIDGRTVYAFAQDATVLKGTMATVHARKITMVYERALRSRAPVIGMFDSAGVRVQDALQSRHYYSYDSIMSFQQMASGVVPQISLVMGPCIGPAAISANLADFLLMTRNSYMYVAGPPDAEKDKLGDARMHDRKSGCCDVLAADDGLCIKKCREMLGYLPSHNQQKPPLAPTTDPVDRRDEELMDLVPVDTSKWSDMRKVIQHIVDDGKYFELKANWAAHLTSGLARFGGMTAGIVGNNSVSMAGAMTYDTADKMARFVRFCDCFSIPVIWMADTPAFYPSVEEERAGIIRHGSKVIYANSENTGPQVTIYVRKCFGGGNLAMPGLNLGGDFAVAWPTIELGLMAPQAATAIIYRKEIEAAPNPEEIKKDRIQKIRKRLDILQQEAAEEYIDPRDTRPYMIRMLKSLRDRVEVRAPRKHDNVPL